MVVGGNLLSMGVQPWLIFISKPETEFEWVIYQQTEIVKLPASMQAVLMMVFSDLRGVVGYGGYVIHMVGGVVKVSGKMGWLHKVIKCILSTWQCLWLMQSIWMWPKGSTMQDQCYWHENKNGVGTVYADLLSQVSHSQNKKKVKVFLFKQSTISPCFLPSVSILTMRKATELLDWLNSHLCPILHKFRPW